MKNNLIPSLLFRALLSFTLGFLVLNTAAFAQKTVRKPGKKMHYTSNFNTRWYHVYNTFYTYNASGKITEILKTDSANANLEKFVYTYDRFGNEIGQLKRFWKNGTWEDFETRNILVYDSQNNLLENTFQMLVSGIWENYEKTSYTFRNGVISEITFQRFDLGTNTWNNNWKETNITWHIPNQVKAEYILQNFNNNAWVNSGKFTTVLTGNGGSETLQQSWQNNTWQNGFKTTTTLDSLGNQIHYLKEYWSNNAWAFYLANDQPITYYPNGDIQEQYSSITCISCSPTGPDKYVYSDYKTFTVTGLKNQIPQEIAASIYPNPTTNLLNIELPEKSQNITAQLTDLTGKVIMSRIFNSSEAKQLNLQTLKPGIYFLSLETEKGKTVRKILKH